MEERTLRIIVDNLVDNQETIVKSARPSIEDMIRFPPRKVLELEVNTLADGVVSTFSTVVDVLSKLPSNNEGISLKEVSFTLGIDSSGEVSLFSTLSGTSATQVGLTFTLSMTEGNSNADSK